MNFWVSSCALNIGTVTPTEESFASTKEAQGAGGTSCELPLQNQLSHSEGAWIQPRSILGRDSTLQKKK